MKTLKSIFILSMAVLLFNCSSSSEEDPTAPITINVDGTLDLNALNSLVGTDATALVTFGGAPAATYTVEAIPGDKVNYKITSSSANTEIRIIDYRFNLNSSTASFDDWEINFTPQIDTIATPATAFIEVNTDAAGEDDYKFDIHFKVYTNGSSNHTIYTVDPKIKLKRRR